ncbi:MBL fold metallo-hydrolase [Geobacillus sp. Y412MC52]|uniref:MBL fold metallo-hydrolase n=1 Tax=Geobacillus sp. (strain Y412MC52) TaxID=550542 RepID=UPI00018C0E4E|nr:MBL fold metallo-hydrolase [Geobacillus sp. Y412MC52]ADU92931.1 beta-lactamase domain protein [Geobacillus sp. Y412MC52]
METYCISIRHTNCYLVKVNDFYVAIDAGWPGCIRQYREALKTYNIKPEMIKYLFVTHFHPDHAGMVENIKRFGTSFILFEHQAPYIRVMENMLRKDRSYLPLDMNSNVVLSIDEAGLFFTEHNIPAQAIKTPGHSDDSISLVFQDGTAFIGDLYSPNLVMEDDDKSKQSWHDLKLKGAKVIYPGHGNVYTLGV